MTQKHVADLEELFILGRTKLFHCYKYGFYEESHILFGYFSSTNESFILYLIRLVEVNLAKKGWIMGVCDLNY